MSETEPTPGARRNRKPYQWLLLVLGPVVLGVILSRLDVDTLWRTLRDVDRSMFLGAGLLLCSTVMVRTWRWRLLLAEVTEDTPSYSDLVMIFAYATFVGVATPGRVGEFVKAFHLRNYGVSMGAAMANVLTDRMLDVIALLVVALMSFFVIVIPGAQSQSIVPVIAGGVVAGVVLAWWLIRSPAFDRVIAFVHRIEFGPARRVLEKLVQVGGDFRSAIQDQSVGTLLISLLLTLGAWGIVYAANWMIAQSIGLDLSYFQIIAVSAVSSVVAQLPVTVLGVGTREATVIVVLSKYGVAKEAAVALSALFLASILFVALVCAFSMLTEPVRFVRRVEVGSN